MENTVPFSSPAELSFARRPNQMEDPGTCLEDILFLFRKSNYFSLGADVHRLGSWRWFLKVKNIALLLRMNISVSVSWVWEQLLWFWKNGKSYGSLLLLQIIADGPSYFELLEIYSWALSILQTRVQVFAVILIRRRKREGLTAATIWESKFYSVLILHASFADSKC